MSASSSLLSFLSTCTFVLVVLFVAISASVLATDGVQEQLEQGKVVVGFKNIGKTKYVSGQILINAPPDQVWSIIVNPFEFQGKISPRMKTVEVVADQSNRSVLRMTMDVLLIPHFTYTVESLYNNDASIQFHRVDGIFKDFRGSWLMVPETGGKTELTYCMYIDTGFPVPQWIVREAIKTELPNILIALRQRVQETAKQPASKEHRNIMAATLNLTHPNSAVSSLPNGLAGQPVQNNN